MFERLGRALQASFIQELFASLLHAETSRTPVVGNRYAYRAGSLGGNMPLQCKLRGGRIFAQGPPVTPAAFAPVERVVPFGVMFDATVDQHQVLLDPAGLAADHGTVLPTVGSPFDVFGEITRGYFCIHVVSRVKVRWVAISSDKRRMECAGSDSL